jgi:transposase InsO family protein
MDVHKNARLTPHSRAELVRRVLDEGQSKAIVAASFGVCSKTVSTWVERYEKEGWDGLYDRSSRPKCSPRLTSIEVVARIATLRRERRTGQQIALEVGVSKATVSRVLQRLGLHRLASLEPAEPVRRYERERPGELIHLDIKKLGRFKTIGHRITGNRKGQSNHRGVGWEFVHVSIDDASRIAFAEILPNEKKESAIAFLKATIAYYERLGIKIERIRTDNGSCYRSKAFKKALKAFGLRQIFTRPYTPKTNGKAERFIQTSLREWAYAMAYENSLQRQAQLAVWLHRYNWHRPHASLRAKPPVTRLGLSMDNLLRLHI